MELVQSLNSIVYLKQHWYYLIAVLLGIVVLSWGAIALYQKRTTKRNSKISHGISGWGR